MKVSVILPAAGLGTRMRAAAEATGTSRKQFMLLEGVPILIHTVRKFVASHHVTEVVIALRSEDIPWVEEMIAHEKFHKTVRCVVGGETRQESVANALASVGGDVDLVAVHDAVRPFVSQEIISAVILEAAHHGAAIVGIERLETVEIRVVAGSDRNIKITRPSDMELAELFLELEREKEAG
jgi:2-C-methyl-D-erythritol 4-phosphate cytidylyltransferase